MADVLYCGMCGCYRRDRPGPCDHCGALTTVEMTPKAEAWLDAVDTKVAEWEASWRAMSQAERERARAEAAKGQVIENARK